MGFHKSHESFLLLEDLSECGFPQRLNAVNLDQVKVVLSWLASFHAKFMGKDPQGLWETGTYWHLETRPDELEVLADARLKRLAPLIDAKLENTPYQTIVHGDAKLANFCFSKDPSKAAAVDFQYVGQGCGMKDVAYFLGSCLDEAQCEALEVELLAYYFDELRAS